MSAFDLQDYRDEDARQMEVHIDERGMLVWFVGIIVRFQQYLRYLQMGIVAIVRYY